MPRGHKKGLTATHKKKKNIYVIHLFLFLSPTLSFFNFLSLSPSYSLFLSVSIYFPSSFSLHTSLSLSLSLSNSLSLSFFNFSFFNCTPFLHLYVLNLYHFLSCFISWHRNLFFLSFYLFTPLPPSRYLRANYG